VWYIIAASRVVRAMPAPTDATSAVQALRRLRSAYHPNALATLNTDRLATQILAGWFRTHPHEASARLTPGDAMEVCRRLRA